ncbi:MAG: hypothetical protein ACFFCX_16450 [Candidatus Sifarchaeia archaeon]
MRSTKAFYEVDSNKQDEIIRKLNEIYGLEPTFIETYISMRGKEESGIETVRLSLEKDMIKVMVVLLDESLLEGFNAILGIPTKLKGSIRKIG